MKRKIRGMRKGLPVVVCLALLIAILTPLLTPIAWAQTLAAWGRVKVGPFLQTIQMTAQGGKGDYSNPAFSPSDLRTNLQKGVTEENPRTIDVGSDPCVPEANVFDDCMAQYCYPDSESCTQALCTPLTSGCAAPCMSIYTVDPSPCQGACRDFQDDRKCVEPYMPAFAACLGDCWSSEKPAPCGYACLAKLEDAMEICRQAETTTPTPTSIWPPTATPTPTPTSTATSTATATPPATPTATPIATPTSTPTLPQLSCQWDFDVESDCPIVLTITAQDSEGHPLDVGIAWSVRGEFKNLAVGPPGSNPLPGAKGGHDCIVYHTGDLGKLPLYFQVDHLRRKTVPAPWNPVKGGVRIEAQGYEEPFLFPWERVPWQKESFIRNCDLEIPYLGVAHEVNGTFHRERSIFKPEKLADGTRLYLDDTVTFVVPDSPWARARASFRWINGFHGQVWADYNPGAVSPGLEIPVFTFGPNPAEMGCAEIIHEPVDLAVELVKGKAQQTAGSRLLSYLFRLPAGAIENVYVVVKVVLGPTAAGERSGLVRCYLLRLKSEVEVFMDAEDRLMVRVFEGSADLFSEEGTTSVSAGEYVTLFADGSVSSPRPFDLSSAERWWEQEEYGEVVPTNYPDSPYVETAKASLTELGPVGDGNGDGRCTEVDALMALKMAVGLQTPDVARMDVNGDGQVTEVDALQILKWAVAGGQCGQR